MASKEIKQKITLDSKDAEKAIKDFNQSIVTGATEANKAITQNSQVFAQNDKQVKKWGQSVRDEFSKFRKSFTDNLATGAKVLALDAGVHVLHKGASDAIDMAVDWSKSFAELKSRIGASDEQLQKWQKSISQTATDTKTNLATMERAFMSLSDSADPAKIQKFLGAVGQATLLAHGNGAAVTEFLKMSIIGQSKEMNEGTVNESLGAADLLRRRGRGYGTMESAMSALGGLNQEAIRTSGLNEHGVAAMLVGASHAGLTGGQAATGINALLQANQNGIMQGSVLAGILGVSGRGALSTNGKFDMSKLGGPGSYQRLLNLGGGNQTKAMEIFRSISGMGPEASDAVFKMIKNFNELNKTMGDAKRDTKSFAKSAEEAGDNIADTYQQFQDKLVTGFHDILSPLLRPLTALIGGHGMAAIGEAPSALAGSLKGIMKHPFLTGGAILGTAAGGALINHLFGGMLGGVAKGEAMKKAGIEPVYVVNAGEIGEKSGGGFVSTMKGLLGTGKQVLADAAILGGSTMTEIGAMGAGAMAISGAAVAASGFAGYELGEGINKLTGNNGQLGAKLYDLLHPQKIKVEVDSKDPLFSAKPKSTDNPRDSRTY